MHIINDLSTAAQVDHVLYVFYGERPDDTFVSFPLILHKMGEIWRVFSHQCTWELKRNYEPDEISSVRTAKVAVTLHLSDSTRSLCMLLFLVEKNELMFPLAYCPLFEM